MALLLITAGRGSGVPFELQPVTRIGRAPDNTLVLQDTVSSRYHARIVRRASDYFIEDLGSLNGTLVNSRPVHQSKLEDGDVIVIGGTELTFSTKSRPGSNASYYERHPSQELIVPHIIKVLEQRSGAAGATMSDSDEAAIEEPWLGREERSRSGHLLEGLLELIWLQRSNVGVAESIEMMLERSLGLFDAFRVAILTPETSGRYEPLIVIPAKLRDADISQPEIDWVVQTQSSIVSCRPTVEDDEDSTALSRKPETILAAPVIANTSVIGVLYLESHVEASSFDESHLELLGAIATLLSVTVERLATLKGAATLSIPDSLEETLPISPRQPARSQFVPWDVASRIHDELLIGPIAALRTAKESGESRDALVLEEDLAQLGREVDHYLGITRISEPHTEASLTELLSRFAARWSVAPSTGRSRSSSRARLRSHWSATRRASNS